MPRRPVRPARLVRPVRCVPPRGAGRSVLAVVLTTTMLLGLAAAPALAAEADPGAVAYRPPVAGPVVDPFDPPARPWQPGNRGIDYGVPAGTEVDAAADGDVVFAGQVGGALHVTLRHADGLRTSYSFLAATSVHVGQRVRAGEAVGVAGGAVHVGVRPPDGPYLGPRRSSRAPAHPGGGGGRVPRAGAPSAPRAARASRPCSTRGRRRSRTWVVGRSAWSSSPPTTPPSSTR